ncbi:methyltransferase domain-containing protein [bacterium]|nr:methyltransferase domain-containing protein [bacterium]
MSDTPDSLFQMIAPGIETYIDDLLPERSSTLLAMEEDSHRNGFPIIGPQVGRMLELLARMIDAGSIFECGSGFGYSALWFLRGAPEAKIICTDGSSANRDKALAAFTKEKVPERITFHTAIAQDVLRQQDGPFDIIFNDIDKEQYPEIPPLAKERLRVGGLLITDNTLWYGKVIEDNPDAATRGVLEYNRLVTDDPEWATILLSVRDGVSVSMKVR